MACPHALTAPQHSSRFTGWAGACTGTGACVVTMNSAFTVDAGSVATVTVHLNVHEPVVNALSCFTDQLGFFFCPAFGNYGVQVAVNGRPDCLILGQAQSEPRPRPPSRSRSRLTRPDGCNSTPILRFHSHAGVANRGANRFERHTAAYAASMSDLAENQPGGRRLLGHGHLRWMSTPHGGQLS
jgi:hypothetical protein